MMMDAVQAGSVERVLYAISLKCSVNCSDPDSGDTPLHVAGKEMKPNVFGFLLLVILTYFPFTYIIICNSLCVRIMKERSRYLYGKL